LIEIEQSWNSDDLVLKKAFTIMQKRVADNISRIAALEAQVKIDRPKALFADAVAALDTISIREMAAILKDNGVNIDQNRLFARLRQDGYLIKKKGADYNSPTQRAMNLGLFKIQETIYKYSGGRVTVCRTTRVTGKGQRYFVRYFLKEESKIA
jgi:anti-repressor protein